ncbi:MAG: NAD kinase [Acholeplasmatales bacterium]|nr:NAD kinase [Acholeplasmatales bacterium]
MKCSFVIRDQDKSLSIANYIKKKLKIEEDNTNPDIIIAIGGDGTILKAVHEYPNAVIFGIHTGHLGFFANYDVTEVDYLIDDINNNNFNVDTLDVLKCEFSDKEGNEYIDFAINEVTIMSPLRTMRLSVTVDNEYIERFRGTGFCVSTPYGSTAYNKSLHGSVVDTTIKVMQLTEIAAINSIAYRTLSSPLILSSDRILKFDSINDNDVFITVDHISYDIKDFDKIKITYLKDKVKMAYNTQKSFFNRINRTFLISKE